VLEVRPFVVPISQKGRRMPQPNILLVHGACGDALHWRQVIPVDGAVLAATQKPLAGNTFAAVSGVLAWKSKPSRYQVWTEDWMIAADTEGVMANRMDAREVIELESGHASLASRPAEVAEFILAAAGRL
jgi:hypothetical protein